MKVCKSCGELLEESMFYNQRAVCKFCLKMKKPSATVRMKLEMAGENVDNLYNKNRTTPITMEEKLMMILKENGNVFVNKMLDLKYVEEQVGFKVAVRDCVGGGYVYERIK